MMWYNIFKFEIKYRVKRVDTYVFFAFLFLFSIVGVDFIFQGVELGPIKKNAPVVIAKAMGAITGIFMIMASMIMGVPVVRDFEYHMESLMFVNPIKKRDYLLGRFLGSFAVLLFIFSGILFGMMLGEYMPWHNSNNLLDFNVVAYLKSFVTVTLPILFFGASLFFVSGTLSRKLVVVYTQGIIFFVIFMLTKAISNEFWQAILDPFSLTTITLVTDSWSAMEKNTQLIPFSHVLLYNKSLWTLLGVGVLLFGYKKFNFNVVKNKKFKVKKKQSIASQIDNTRTILIPQFKIQQGLRLQWTQLKQLTWFYFSTICKQPSFWAIMICGMIIILINSVSLGTVYGVDSYPATYFIVEELQETSIYFFIILLLFYSGELIWKERSVKLNLMYDATPISGFVSLLGKYLGLILVYSLLMLALIISGVIFQTLHGYYNYEFEVYFYGFFLEILPFLALYTFISFFIHAIINHKFIGIMAVLMVFISIIALGIFGFDHDLYFFGGSSLGKYSDMNGYGHLLKPYLFVKTYWLLFGLLLLIAASLFLVRGTETKFIRRLKAYRNRLSRPLLKFASVIAISFIGIGSYIFYNTNILNEYWTNSEETAFRVSYEKTLKQFEYIPQPKIIDVHLEVALYPSERNYTVEGYYMLKNTTKTIINEIHIQKLIESDIKLDPVLFDGGATENTQYREYDYSIYRLNKRLLPGDVIKMRFRQDYIVSGFESPVSKTKIIENGTFFTNKDFPTLGYNRKYEIQDNDERKQYNLPVRLDKASRSEVKELVHARSGSDSDGITFEMTISTDKDQTAIAPGTLIKQWNVNDRNYFHYKMDGPMIDFYSIVSGRYEVMKDQWIPSSTSISKPIDLEIYYHKGHEYNLGRMMESMKASLKYFSAHFSPYQYNQLRIMEFPRYATFAQSFPGTVPFSESIGFVLNIDDEKDVDMAFYVTAHEIAHQWWGMQVEAANVQGQSMILETLAQYSALMVLKQRYSKKKIQQFLELQSALYLDGKRRESSKEPALTLVEGHEYVYYNKGVIAMYVLQDRIGAEKVNMALRRFITDWNTIDGTIKVTTDRYATTKDLIHYFEEVTPDSLQPLIHDLFETTDTNQILNFEKDMSKALKTGAIIK